MPQQFFIPAIGDSHDNSYGYLDAQMLTEAQRKRYEKIVSYFKQNPLTVESWNSLFQPTTGYVPRVSLETLNQTAQNAPVKQCHIDPNRVLSLFDSKELGVMEGHPFYTLVELGFYPEDLELIDSPLLQYPDMVWQSEIRLPRDVRNGITQSGRHRITGYNTAAVLSGIPIERFNELLVPVLFAEYSLEAIQAANGSRSHTTGEKSSFKVQDLGIPNNPEAVAVAISEGKIKIPLGYRVILQMFAEDDNELKTTVNAVGDIGAKLATALNRDKFKFPNRPENILSMLQHLYARIPNEITGLEKLGITNIARNGCSTISEHLAKYTKTNRSSLWSEMAVVTTPPQNSSKKSRSTKKTPQG